MRLDCSSIMFMNDEIRQCIDRVCALAERYRAQCLWFMKEDYLPSSVNSAIRVLSYIEKYGDLAAFEESVLLRKCLLHSSSVKCAQ